MAPMIVEYKCPRRFVEYVNFVHCNETRQAFGYNSPRTPCKTENNNIKRHLQLEQSSRLLHSTLPLPLLATGTLDALINTTQLQSEARS